MEEKKPRTGGKAGDRTVRVTRADHSKGGKSDKGQSRGNQPKYDDTEEAKKQKKLIRDIENEIQQVQSDLKRQDRVKVVKRSQPRVHLEDKNEIEARIKEFEDRIAKKEEEVKQMQPNIKRLQEAANEKRALLNKLKTSVFFPNGGQKDFIEANEKKLQEEIKRLEGRLETESLTISEEKVVVKDIKRLKSMRQNFAPYQKRYNESKNVQDKLSAEVRESQAKLKKIEDWKEEIISLKQDLLSLSEKEKEAKKQVEEDKKKAETIEAKEKDEKQKAIDKIDQLANKLRVERENLRINRDNWYESKRQARTKKMDEQNQERAERRKEVERSQKDKVVQIRLDKKQEIPFEYEMGACQSLINYLTELLNATKVTEQKDEKAEGKKEEPKKEEPKKEEGKKEEKGYIKGREDPEDLLFPDLAGQKKKASKKKKKKVPAKITHNWDTFTRFEELGLSDPPITNEQIPKAIESVRAKLAELQKQSAEKRAITLKEIEKEEAEEKLAEVQRKKQAEQEKKEGDSAPQETKREAKKEEDKASTETKTENK